MDGVIPSPEFMDQIKRYVRESIRRERDFRIPTGRWHKKGGGGGAGRIMFFRIREVDCYTGDWWVEVTFVSSCEPIPDQRGDDLVRVKPSCCKSPFTDDELVLSGYGTAAYVYPVDSCGVSGQWREIVHCADNGCDAEDGHEECNE